MQDQKEGPCRVPYPIILVISGFLTHYVFTAGEEEGAGIGSGTGAESGAGAGFQA